MGIRIDWCHPQQTLMRWTFTGETTLADFQAAIQQSYTLASEVNHPFDLILDANQTALRSLYLPTLREIMQSQQIQLIFVVNGPSFSRLVQQHLQSLPLPGDRNHDVIFSSSAAEAARISGQLGASREHHFVEPVDPR